MYKKRRDKNHIFFMKLRLYTFPDIISKEMWLILFYQIHVWKHDRERDYERKNRGDNDR